MSHYTVLKMLTNTMLLLMILLAVDVHGSGPCTLNPCTCFAEVIICTGQGLNNVPEFKKYEVNNVKVLNIQNNFIKTIPTLNWPDLKTILAQGNPLICREITDRQITSDCDTMITTTTTISEATTSDAEMISLGTIPTTSHPDQDTTSLNPTRKHITEERATSSPPHKDITTATTTRILLTSPPDTSTTSTSRIATTPTKSSTTHTAQSSSPPDTTTSTTPQESSTRVYTYITFGIITAVFIIAIFFIIILYRYLNRRQSVPEAIPMTVFSDNSFPFSDSTLTHSTIIPQASSTPNTSSASSSHISTDTMNNPKAEPVTPPSLTPEPDTKDTATTAPVRAEPNIPEPDNTAPVLTEPADAERIAMDTHDAPAFNTRSRKRNN